MAKGLTDKVEVLLEERLRRRVESEDSRRVAIARHEVNRDKTCCGYRKSLCADQLTAHSLPIRETLVVLIHRLLVPEGGDPLAAPHRIVRHDEGVLRQQVEQRTIGIVVATDLRYNPDRVQFFLRQLRLYVKRADRLDLVAKKVHTIGPFVGKREDV